MTGTHLTEKQDILRRAEFPFLVSATADKGLLLGPHATKSRCWFSFGKKRVDCRPLISACLLLVGILHAQAHASAAFNSSTEFTNSSTRPTANQPQRMVLLRHAGSPGSHLSQEVQDSSKPSSSEIEVWVAQLGSDQFDLRENAKQKLRASGVEAFDALYSACNHRDLEVKLAARRLVQELEIPWTRETDSAATKRILAFYNRKQEPERKSGAEQLSKLPQSQEWLGLIRVVRFDLSEAVSKRASLLLMNRVLEEDADFQRQFSIQMEGELNDSQRTASHWLRLFVGSLKNRIVAKEEWREVIAFENRLLRTQASQQDSEVIRKLVYCYSDLLFEFGDDSAGKEVLHELVPHLADSEDAILEAVDRLTLREAWPVIDAIVSNHKTFFESDPLLLYQVAEVQRQIGNELAATDYAELAGSQLGNDGRAKMEVAAHLLERGFEHWAKRELESVIALSPIGSIPNVDARLLLGELLASAGDTKGAADLLSQLNQAVADDEKVRREIKRKHHPPTLVALQHFYRGQALLGEEQSEAAWETFLLGHEADPNHPDTLIELYRLADSDEVRREAINKELDKAIGWYLDRSREFEAGLSDFQEGGSRRVAADILANISNKLAWLLVNCERDFEQAIQYAERAVELDPDRASYWDTLATCQLSSNKAEAALLSQRQAVKLSPYSSYFRDRLEQMESPD